MTDTWNSPAQDEAPALAALAAEYLARTDRIVEGAIDPLFTPDGRIRIAALACNGRDAIAAYFAGRRAQEDASGRRTRHMMSNFVVESASGQDARVRFLCAVFAGVGTIPFASAAPSTIGDFSAACVKVDGCWLFAELSAAVVFVGAGAAPFVRQES